MRREWAAWGPLILRVVLGIGFIYHGFPKLFSGQGHQMTEGLIAGIGLPLPGLLAWVVAILEVFGGLALIAGAFVTVVGALFVVEMLVALFGIHWSQGFNFVHVTGMTDAGPQFGMPGWEVPFVYLGGLLCLILAGPGGWSVDEMRAGKAAPGP